MIKKISSWVFGSFFRTMGRFFFFLFFGFLVAMIIQKNDWSSIHWTDLFGLEYVKADTWDTGVMRNVTCQIDTVNWTCQTVNYYTYIQWGQSLDPHRFVYNFDTVTLSSTGNTMYVTASVYPYTATGVSSDESFVSNGNTVSYSRGSDYYRFILNLTYKDNNNVEHACIMDNASFPNVVFKCPVGSTKSVKQFYLEYQGLSPMDFVGNQEIKIGIYRIFQITNSTEQSIINNQNQNTNQTISTITDTNVTQADTEANSFFSSFTSQDNGGISSIITAPLQAISGLVSAQCVQIELPIPYLDNKKLILPCMSAIYQQHFGAIFNLYQTIIFGAIAYRMLVSLFMMIQGFKNPDDDKIEVVDL